MKKRNKMVSILIIICVIVGCNLIACTQNDENNEEAVQTSQANEEVVADTQEKPKTPEEFIEEMYRGLIDKKVTYEDLWDNYVSETTKKLGIYTKESYINGKKENEFKNNIIRTDIMVVSSENVKENIFKVKSVLKYTQNGKEMNEECYDYVIKENDTFKYLLNGDLSVIKHTDITKENIIYKNINQINYVEGIQISFDLENEYKNAIILGWVEGPTFILKTDKGNFSTTIKTIKISKGQTQNFKIEFKNAEGTPQELQISNINYLSNDGLPEDTSGGKTHNIPIN